MRTFGLIGKNLSHSFSKQYFSKKFIENKITDTEYLNFELEEISEFKRLIRRKKIHGLNVTIPYKESIIPLLDELSEEAKLINAVNTIHFQNEKLIGHNTDYIGFINSIQPLLNGRNKALILGSGGVSKAIQYALIQLGIKYKTASRNTSFDYLDISKEITDYYNIIINTTPVGSYTSIDQYPNIPYKYLNEKNLLFDVIYNPHETKFLAYGRMKNTQTKNGLEMLKIQAEESWRIWNR